MKLQFENAPTWRGAAVLILPMILLAALAGRLVHIKAALTDRLQPRIESQHHSRIILPARRGMIFDTRGRVLAGTRAAVSLYADPTLLNDRDEALDPISALLKLNRREVQDRLHHPSSPRFCWIERRIEPNEAEAVAKLKIPGLGTVRESQRIYPLGSTLAHVLGFVGEDQTGLEGIESLLDDHLRGMDGSRVAYVTASRRAISEAEDSLMAPRDGGHVVLTIDSVIQEITERTLARHIEKFQAAGGTCVVMSPQTGEILALASWPTFEPADYQRFPASARRNIALTDQVEPGSTLKPFIAAAALSAGLASRTEKIDCHQGACHFGQRLIHDTKPHGLLTPAEIVIKSSNIGMAFLGNRMGNPVLYDTLRRYGFGSPTGVELPGEGSGIVAPLEEWTSYSTSSVPFGQEIAVTPLQLAAAFCALLNDGVYLRPRILRSLLSPDGTVLESFDDPEPVRRVLDADVARYFREDVLVRVVNEGATATLAEYQVTGKTGTAQVSKRDRKGYEHGAYISSFMGAAPATDPQVAAVLMIHRPNPSIAYYGRQVAAPAVAAILGEVLAYLEIPPDAEPREGEQRRHQLAAAKE